MTNYFPLILSVVVVAVMLLYLAGKNSYPEVPILTPPLIPTPPVVPTPAGGGGGSSSGGSSGNPPSGSGSSTPPPSSGSGTLLGVEGYTPGYLDTGGYQSDYTSTNNGGIYSLVDPGASDILNGYNLLA